MQRPGKLSAALIVPLLVYLALAAEAAPKSKSIEISFLKGTYENLDSRIHPVKQGPLTIRVSSPSHRFVIYSNRLTLTEAGDGTADARMRVEFEGRGELVAQLEGLGPASSLKDTVSVERQALEVEGRVRIERGDGAYVVTVVEAPETLTLAIESRLAQQFVGACRGFSRIPLISLDCEAIQKGLSVVNVPLPGPGERFFLEDSQLTRKERAFFDRWVRRGG